MQEPRHALFDIGGIMQFVIQPYKCQQQRCRRLSLQGGEQQMLVLTIRLPDLPLHPVAVYRALEMPLRHTHQYPRTRHAHFPFRVKAYHPQGENGHRTRTTPTEESVNKLAPMYPLPFRQGICAFTRHGRSLPLLKFQEIPQGTRHRGKLLRRSLQVKS